MSIFHFPKYFRLFLIFLFFLFFLKNKNKGEHILFVGFLFVSISFFPDFSGIPQISLFFSCQRFTKKCQRFPKTCQRFTKTCQRFTKKANADHSWGFPFLGLFWAFWSNFFLSFYFFLFLFISFYFFFSLFELSEKVGLKMIYWNLQNNWWILYSILVLDVDKTPRILPVSESNGRDSSITL